MSLNAATIEILISKGLSASDILDVARATEVKADPTNAVRQARHRANKRNAVTVTENAPLIEDHNPPASSEPEGSPEARRGRSKSKIDLPDWMPVEPWAEFVAHRKAMRGIPFTEAAAKGVIREVEKFRGQGHCPAKLLQKAVTRGWRTVFADEDTRAATGSNGRPYAPTSAADCERSAAFWESQGETSKAAEMRRQAAEWREKPPDPAVASILAKTAQRLHA